MKSLAGASILAIGCAIAPLALADREDPAAYAALSVDTFEPVFQALREGDLQTLKLYLHPNLYEEYRVLFEQNDAYDAFLRDYYSGADFHLDRVTAVDGGYIGDVTIYWTNGQTAEFQLMVTPGHGNNHVSAPPGH